MVPAMWVRFLQLERKGVFSGVVRVSTATSIKPAICVHSFSSTAFRLQQSQLTKKDGDLTENQNERKWWKFTEWKVVASVAIAVVSYFANARLERNRIKKELKLNRVQSQIQHLYGPLYGNRFVSETSYRAVMKSHKGLKKYLEEARVKRDAEMIRRWRSYVWNVLYPLDKAAVDMILQNGHLIEHGQFPTEFEEILVHTAKMEFVMEHWKTDSGNLEAAKDFTEDDFLEMNNASCIGGRSRALYHAKKKYDELREEQKRISLEIGDERNADAAFLSAFSKLL